MILKVWINQGDIILIGLRDYQDAKADVILRYNPDEARNLKSYGELPETGENGCEYNKNTVKSYCAKIYSKTFEEETFTVFKTLLNCECFR